MIGDRLAAARRRRGLTQADLAEALGGRYNQQMISHVERGRSSLLTEGLAVAAEVLGVSADYLLGLTDDDGSVGEGAASGIQRLTDIPEVVLIPHEPGIPASDQGSAITSEFDGVPIPLSFLTHHGINPRSARIYDVQGQSMYPTLPHGSTVLVDYGRRWLRENLIYLVIINSAYEFRRLRVDARQDYEWNTEFYLDLQHSGGSWPAGSWRREFWRDVVRENVLIGTEISMITPVLHGDDIRVVGQVRGVLVRMFDDEGW